MKKPDYDGGGLVNLMTSLIRARGGDSELPELNLLPASALGAARHLMLLVIDGLGAAWLQRHRPDGLLSRHCLGAITSVFPTTTASAITTILTGEAPRQHAITGWFTWLRELGCLVKVLSGEPRYGGLDYRSAGVDARTLFGLRPIAERIATPATLIAPRAIAASAFNQALLGPASLRVFNSLRGLFKEAANAVRRARAPGYFYAYWPELDGIGHSLGIESAAAIEHLALIEQELERFLRRIQGTGTELLVVADHGQIDHGRADRIDLGAHPQLTACLRLPLCGEARAAYCYLRPGFSSTFESYCREHFGERLLLERSDVLMASGLFGSGPPHPELAHRIGDFMLIGQGRTVVFDRMISEAPYTPIGVHGGLSSAELFVPLCRFSA